VQQQQRNIEFAFDHLRKVKSGRHTAAVPFTLAVKQTDAELSANRMVMNWL
jgi:hypothetical protein